MGFIKVWECFIQPFARIFQLILGGRDHYFIVDFCLFNIDAPRLFLDDFLKQGLINVHVGVKGKGDLECFVLEISERYGHDRFNKGVVFFQEVNIFVTS